MSSLSKKVLGCYNFRKTTPREIEVNTEKLMEELRVQYDAVGAVKLDQISFANVLKAIADIMCDRSTKGAPLFFAQHASTNKALRDASFKAETRLEEFDVEMSMKKDVFDRIFAFKERVGVEGLNPEQRRFLEKLIRIGKRNGLLLSEETRFKLKAVKKRISELCIKFENNVNEDNTKLYFTKEELAGMSEEFINDLNVIDGKLEVTLKQSHIFPIMKKCHVSHTRKVVAAASHAKCMDENTPILEELITLRQKHADLLGYPSHASYIQEERMAKSPEKVIGFLSYLSSKFQALWESEMNAMLKLKNEECQKYGYKNSGKIEFWDLSYYMNKVEEKIYLVDEDEVRQYFPIAKVTSGLLDMYQRLLGLKFYVVYEFETWHPDVVLYRVHDSGTSELLGYFFLDLYWREGKFGHAAVFPLEPSCIGRDGQRQTPVCAVMCNFTKPTNDKPSLLSHSEVETFFHEFGHAMHSICVKVTFSIFAGVNVERDFVEAPSQMLENWVWEKKPLQLLSGHYKTGESLPNTLIHKLCQCKKVNTGCLNLQQIVLSTFDQRIHTRDSANTQELFAQTYEESMGISPIPGTNMPASFVYLAGGYDAQYYGYLWSEMFATDMYVSRFKKEGILNPVVGMEYRTKILQPGGSKDAYTLLKEFLGRDPSHVAFLKSKGLEE